jgi:predicted metallo-beta-lactamase superfamily hydrolase
MELCLFRVDQIRKSEAAIRRLSELVKDPNDQCINDHRALIQNLMRYDDVRSMIMQSDHERASHAFALIQRPQHDNLPCGPYRDNLSRHERTNPYRDNLSYERTNPYRDNLSHERY